VWLPDIIGEHLIGGWQPGLQALHDNIGLGPIPNEQSWAKLQSERVMKSLFGPIIHTHIYFFMRYNELNRGKYDMCKIAYGPIILDSSFGSSSIGTDDCG
jgi:hypothetical protein